MSSRFTFVQVFFARGALVAATTFALVWRYTLATVETTWLTNRHTRLTVTRESLLALATK